MKVTLCTEGKLLITAVHRAGSAFTFTDPPNAQWQWKFFNVLVKSPFPQDKASKYLRDIYIILCNIYQKWINCQALAVLVQATQKKDSKISSP